MRRSSSAPGGAAVRDSRTVLIRLHRGKHRASNSAHVRRLQLRPSRVSFRASSRAGADRWAPCPTFELGGMIATRRWTLENRIPVGWLVAVIILAGAGCKSKPVDLAELYATRAAGTTFLERGQLPEAETQFKKLIDLA